MSGKITVYAIISTQQYNRETVNQGGEKMKDKNLRQKRNRSGKEQFVEVESPDDFRYEGETSKNPKNKTSKQK